MGNAVSKALILCLLLSMPLAGCIQRSATLVAANTTRPVLVGPMMRINGSVDESTKLTLKKRVVVENKSTSLSAGGAVGNQYQTTTSRVQEGSGKTDALLLRYAPPSADAKLWFNNVILGSYYHCTLFVNDKVWVRASGGYYE